MGLKDDIYNSLVKNLGEDNVEQLPDHLASALTKDYSQMLKIADQKSKVKNGA